jgi:hypothetical protein
LSAIRLSSGWRTSEETSLSLVCELNFGSGSLTETIRRQPLAHVVARQAHLLPLQDAALLRIIVERAGERGAEGGKVGAAVALRDVVGEAEDLLVIAVVPFERDVDADILALPGDGNRLGNERSLGAVEITTKAPMPPS